ncbi:hypothetical protein PoB_000011600 [Plakobranchus ocellatus]|uniref:Uncharacterized protein n=1 Tax=Plakobranchus ocellatus TaxID=259542 RepID=A0AAV3WRL4_9GAST|nr:hypothetical protein PoB_000011600 [Plakobranchus ocellatus]
MSLNSEAFDEIQLLQQRLQESNHSPESPDHKFLNYYACAQNLPQLQYKWLFQMGNPPKAVQAIPIVQGQGMCVSMDLM